MSSRKQRRNGNQNESKVSSKAKKQLVIMIVSILIMVFCVMQVFYLTKYTLGHEISSDKLSVYRWVKLLVNGDVTQSEDGKTTSNN